MAIYLDEKRHNLGLPDGTLVENKHGDRGMLIGKDDLVHGSSTETPSNYSAGLQDGLDYIWAQWEHHNVPAGYERAVDFDMKDFKKHIIKLADPAAANAIAEYEKNYEPSYKEKIANLRAPCILAGHEMIDGGGKKRWCKHCDSADQTLNAAGEWI